VNSNIELTKGAHHSRDFTIQKVFYSGGRNMKLCYVWWVCLHDKFWELVDHKQRWSTSFPLHVYWPIYNNVDCKLKIENG
jgi:hypothetical protein